MEDKTQDKMNGTKPRTKLGLGKRKKNTYTATHIISVTISDFHNMIIVAKRFHDNNDIAISKQKNLKKRIMSSVNHL